jgi:hypothetical protein
LDGQVGPPCSHTAHPQCLPSDGSLNTIPLGRAQQTTGRPPAARIG